MSTSRKRKRSSEDSESQSKKKSSATSKKVAAESSEENSEDTTNSQTISETDSDPDVRKPLAKKRKQSNPVQEMNHDELQKRRQLELIAQQRDATTLIYLAEKMTVADLKKKKPPIKGRTIVWYYKDKDHISHIVGTGETKPQIESNLKVKRTQFSHFIETLSCWVNKDTQEVLTLDNLKNEELMKNAKRLGSKQLKKLWKKKYPEQLKSKKKRMYPQQQEENSKQRELMYKQQEAQIVIYQDEEISVAELKEKIVHRTPIFVSGNKIFSIAEKPTDIPAEDLKKMSFSDYLNRLKIWINRDSKTVLSLEDTKKIDSTNKDIYQISVKSYQIILRNKNKIKSEMPEEAKEAWQTQLNLINQQRDATTVIYLGEKMTVADLKKKKPPIKGRTIVWYYKDETLIRHIVGIGKTKPQIESDLEVIKTNFENLIKNLSLWVNLTTLEVLTLDDLNNEELMKNATKITQRAFFKHWKKEWDRVNPQQQEINSNTRTKTTSPKENTPLEIGMDQEMEQETQQEFVGSSPLAQMSMFRQYAPNQVHRIEQQDLQNFQTQILPSQVSQQMSQNNQNLQPQSLYQPQPLQYQPQPLQYQPQLLQYQPQLLSQQNQRQQLQQRQQLDPLEYQQRYTR